MLTKYSVSRSIILLLTLGAGLATTLSFANAELHWDETQYARPSLQLTPMRATTFSGDGLKLALKRYPRPGAPAVLLIHGLAQNDRSWDAGVPRYSFARFLHAHGFDVWIGNMRSAGTPGFRSETPRGPRHWTVDDLAIQDLPALVDKVASETGKTPSIGAHSMGAWVLEGYLAGLKYDSKGRVRADSMVSFIRRNRIPAVFSIAGVYSLWWPKSIDEAGGDSIRSLDDYYQSNYELELLTRARPLYYVVPNLPALPLGWIGSVLNLPLESIPWIGGSLQRLYIDFQNSVINTPILSMFYYAPNIDPELVRLHGQDGLEDLGPKLLEQIANAHNDRRTSSHYHLDRPSDAYDYATIRTSLKLPTLIVAGGRDRLANISMIYNDGFLPLRSRNKQFLPVEDAGHLDIISGKNAPTEVMAPVSKWLHEKAR